MAIHTVWMKTFFVGIVIVLMWGCGEGPKEDSDPTQISLALGGEDCEFYLGAVEGALKKVKGVTAVDVKSQKHKALVTTDGSISPSIVAGAVDGLSGEGWECEAEVEN